VCSIALYSPPKKIGGLAHAMLSSLERAKFKTNLAKFVDASISMMVEELNKKGCKNSELVAKLAGEAYMFGSIPKDSSLNIGAQNVKMAKDKLKMLGISSLWSTIAS
jgi:chemotaxis protein CheD